VSGRIVIGVGASHTTLMNTRWAEVDHLGEAHRFRDALGEARVELESAGVDLVVVIGSNHFRGLWLDLMPSFTLGVGELVGEGEHGTPSGPLPTDPAAARILCSELVGAGFDLAQSGSLRVDHGITHAVQYVVPPGTPVLALVVNCFAPPLPPLWRCLDLGRALAGAVAALPGDTRVGVVATGGLSHALPFPDWRDPVTDDDHFLVDSWIHGRGRWREYEQRRRSIILAATPAIAEDLDRDFLAALGEGETSGWAAEREGGVLETQGGNGAAELRSWLVMAAALGHAPGRTLAYSPVPQWLTGMAVAVVGRPDPVTAGGGDHNHTQPTGEPK